MGRTKTVIESRIEPYDIAKARCGCAFSRAADAVYQVGVSLYNPTGSAINARVLQVSADSSNTGNFEAIFFMLTSGQVGSIITDVDSRNLSDGSTPVCQAQTWRTEVLEQPFARAKKRETRFIPWRFAKGSRIIVTPGNYLSIITESVNVAIGGGLLWEEVRR